MSWGLGNNSGDRPFADFGFCNDALAFSLTICASIDSCSRGRHVVCVSEWLCGRRYAILGVSRCSIDADIDTCTCGLQPGCSLACYTFFITSISKQPDKPHSQSFSTTRLLSCSANTGIPAISPNATVLEFHNDRSRPFASASACPAINMLHAYTLRTACHTLL